MPTPPVPSEEVEEAVRLRKEGWTYKQIGAKFGITKEAASNRVRVIGGYRPKKEPRECVLYECSKVFVPNHPKQRCCSKKHIKKHLAREERGVVIEEAECLLPECSISVRRIGIFHRYCSDNHRDLDWRRWNLSGFYEAILGNRKPCAVCGEKYVVEEHHTEYEGTKSNKDGPTIDLCPTHHMAIHRGFARINDAGEFESLVEVIEEGLKRKQKEKIDV